MRLLFKGTVQFALLAWSALVIVPFVMIFLLSFRSNADVYNNGLGLGGSFHPENYLTAWNGAGGTIGMSTYFQNSIATALTALAVSLSAGVAAAYFSIHLGPRQRAWFLRTFVIASVIPLVLLIVPFYQAFNALGILNNPVAVGVAYGAITLPTTVLIMHSFYVDFPRELLESASMDGAGPWRTFVQFVLPLSVGAITAVSMLVLVFVWGETQVGVILLQDAASQTVPVGLLSFQGQWSTNLGALFAGLAIASFPVMLIYLTFNKNLAKGITMGGFGGK